MFALVDCNNFYVSCERVFNPGLEGKPVVVLSNNDGCIISRSEEAKKLGLQMAEPAFKKIKFLNDNGVQIFSSNYTLYGDMSARVTETLSQYTPIEKVWGIGRQYAKLLIQNNINTAYDFTLLDDGWLRTKMKVIGLRIKRELLGESCIQLELIIQAKKAIATTRAFGKKTSELKYIEEAVSTYAVRCAEKLRKQNSVANLLTVFIHTDPFNPNEPQFNKSKTITLPVATNDSIELVKYSLICFKEIFSQGFRYKKAGVIVDGLQNESHFQQNIFDRTNRKKQRELFKLIDNLNREFGRDKVKLAVQGDGKEWKLRQEKLSKRYTTNWNEIIEVKA